MLAAGLLGWAGSAAAQDLDPRRWSHLPVEVNYAGAGYAYTRADISFDPVLELQDVEMSMHALAAKYLRSFELLGKSARFELGAPVQDAHWEGLLQGAPASTSREGLGDPVARFAVNLIGAPPLKAGEFPAYRAATPVETTVGAGMAVQMPFGQYDETRLLNLGENRYSFRPELGVEHRRGKWLAELSGATVFYTVNDEFWNGNERKQDPMFISQAYLSYTFRPGLWMGGGVGYGFGGETAINGVAKDDSRGNLASGIVAGVPINRAAGLKIAYLRNRTHKSTGADADTLAMALSMLW